MSTPYDRGVDACPGLFYTEALKRTVVEPVIRSKVGDDAGYFDIDNPTFYQRRSNSKEIIISSFREVDGKRALNEESFVFVFDCELKKIIEYYAI